MDLDQRQARGRSRVDRRVHRLDQRGLAHAARAPQHGVVGRQAGGEAQRVVEQDLAQPLHALQQIDIDAADSRHRLEPVAVGVPDEGVGGVEIDRRRRRRRQAFQRFGDAAQQRRQRRLRMGHGRADPRRYSAQHHRVNRVRARRLLAL